MTMSHFIRFFLIFPLLCLPLCAKTIASEPYGTCAHLAGGEEHQLIPANLIKMREAGITWARADFSWSAVERPQGTWHFEHLDYLMDQAGKHGITILPILDYTTSWATPSHEHPEEWLGYVRQVVTRYKDRIRCWEVWNEENLKGFWKVDPNPEDYAQFLKITYEEIKKIDPDLVVVYGGLAGVPAEYYEKSLKAGAGKYFNVINIHPYRGGLTSFSAVQKFLGDIQKFHDLTVQYTGADKPCWITEMGWATPPVLGRNLKAFLEGALKKCFPNGVNGPICVVCDGNYPPSFGIDAPTWKNLLPAGSQVEILTLPMLKGLDPKTRPALILPPGECFPTPLADDLRAYVRDGGTLILTGGVPFYYAMAPAETGVWDRPQNPYAGIPLANSFRVHWIAWWTEKGTPEHTALKFTPGSADALAAYPIAKAQGSRFFTDAKLKEGDSFEPLFIPTDAKWTDGPKKDSAFDAPAAAIYHFGSDWKGKIVVSAVMGDSIANTNRCVPENQGIFLSQAILLALSNGVERYFCYEFQAPERDDVDPESHFGITHRDLSPKSGYIAYKTLTAARPAGSVDLEGERFLDENRLCVLSWKRPDGKTGYAVWTPGLPREYDVQILAGTVTESFNYLGDEVKVTDRMEFRPGITYFIGENLKIRIQ